MQRAESEGAAPRVKLHALGWHRLDSYQGGLAMPFAQTLTKSQDRLIKKEVKMEEKTPEELKAESKRWLKKGVTLEEEGKSEKMIEMCLQKALDFEVRSLE